MKKVLIVSNRLPVTVTMKENNFKITPSTGGLATGLNSALKETEYIWVGWPGFNKDSNEERLNSITEELNKHKMFPVYLTKEQVNNFYEGFSNSTLWPLFHYFPMFTTFTESEWKAYRKVNELFCEEVVKYVDNDTTVWVHDYQLLLLPELIRRKFPDIKIGFFQHIPFPSYEMFRILSVREDLLKGMLGADLIGFHTYDDVKHFLTSVGRIVGVNNKMTDLFYDNRKISVDAFPMSINYEQLEENSKSKFTAKKMAEYKQQFGDVKIVLSVDRLDYTKGLSERIKGFELFLDTYPEYHEKVCLMMIVAPSRERVSKYKKLKTELDKLVGSINAKYRTIQWTPVLYFYRSFAFNTLPAIYKMADIALVTPLRDGMNLVCKEYIATRTDQTGVLILSEMAGAAKELHEAIIINPYNVNEIAEAIKTALLLPPKEQERRMNEMQSLLKKHNVENWVKTFITKLDDIDNEEPEPDDKSIKEILHEMANKYSSSKKRKFFLDYDGTLVSIKNKPEMAKPDPELINLLNNISADPDNRLIIITGRDKETIDSWLKDVSNVDIIAEHGLWKKRYGSEWTTNFLISNDWKDNIRELLEKFVNRTPGSLIEEKSLSLAWHYRLSDPELSEIRCRELVDILQYFTSNLKLTILEGRKVVEIKSSEVNKGTALQEWLDEGDEFILAAGDDLTDEDMFRALPSNAYSIKIGSAKSDAKFNLYNKQEESTVTFRNFLSNLIFKERIKETIS